MNKEKERIRVNVVERSPIWILLIVATFKDVQIMEKIHRWEELVNQVRLNLRMSFSHRKILPTSQVK